jgi:hypothetical protein
MLATWMKHAAFGTSKVLGVKPTNVNFKVNAPDIYVAS